MKNKRILSLLLTIILLSAIVFQLQNINVSAAETESEEVSGFGIVTNNTEFYIKNANSGQYLDLDHGTDANNTNIHQWKYNGQKNQRWKFVIVGTVGDGCLYKIVSVDSSTGRVVDVSKGGSSNNLNVALYQYKGSSNQQFAIERTKYGAYKILSKCSNFKSGLTVKAKSCSEGANVIQYQYNASHNDEWYLEPVNKTVKYGTSYAYSNALSKSSVTYPYLDSLGGDCANFVSQCLVASGVHYSGNWYIYKKNNDNNSPSEVSQLNNSWQLSSPSPWISAVKFGDYWSNKATNYTYTGNQLYNGEYVNSNIGVGDVVQYGNKDLWNYEGEHTMYITGRNNNKITVSYHSLGQRDAELNTLYEMNKGKYFRFYNII